MRDTDYNSLRREFLGVGLTGAMAGLAGCSNVIGSDDEGPNIDTAGFDFSYDEVARQVEIEFIGGAAIDAGDVQIQYTGGNEVLWAELGSTAAGVDEDIEAGAVATLGPEILNWETPIEAGDTIRIIYVGKETPTTIERYTPPSETDTETDTETEESEVLEQSLPDPESYIPSGREDYDRSIGTVSVSTSEGSVTLDGPGSQQVTAIAGYLAAEDVGVETMNFQEGNNETKRIATNATFGSDNLSFAPDAFQGIAIQATAGINLVIDGETVAENVSTVRYDSSRGVFEQQGVTEEPDVRSILEQSLPDPESFIGSGTRSNYTRAIGTVEISTSEGELFLEGPGNNEITAIGGYLAADNLTETDSWGQDVENDTKLIGTNATFRGDRLSFDADSFRGIALRAVRGVNLVIDGETVAENVSTVRYDSSRGVFEQQGV